MDPDQKAAMDTAAGEAEKEYYDLFDKEYLEGSVGNCKVTEAVARWAKKWYPKCGYKRLGLIVSQRESFIEEV